MTFRVTTARATPSWKRLLSPIGYLGIRHDKKRSFDWYWPLALTVATITLLWSLPVQPAVLGTDGFIRGVRDLIGLFAAFYVVALAAVATFSRESLDATMEGTSPKFAGKELTRRQFICYLFGYLSILAFFLFLMVVLAEVIVPSMRLELPANYYWWFKAISGFLFALGFWNMFVTTLLGVYFLVERVHIDTPKSNGNAELSPTRLTPIRASPRISTN